MTTFDKDTLKVLCGAGDDIIARRELRIQGLEDEHSKCRNPFRKQLLHEAIVGEGKALEVLRNLQKQRQEAIAE